MPPARSGLVVIDKPAGWTSAQVVGRVRRLAGTRKVGHAGTLDPMATGVLVLGISRATRLLGYLTRTDKAYAATVRLGLATITDDAEGEVVQTRGAGAVTAADVETRLADFRGAITQVPSSVSAIKVGGVRAYAKVRAGHEVVLAARPVRVSRLICTATRAGEVDGVPVLDCDLEVECTSGTYIRALARDLGTALDTGGHLTALRRTRVGPFSIDAAQTFAAAAERLELIGLDAAARQLFPTRSVDPVQTEDVRHGRRLEGVALTRSPTAILTPDGQFLALYRAAGSDAVAEAVFPPDGDDSERDKRPRASD